MLKSITSTNDRSEVSSARQALRAAEDVETRARASFDALAQSETDLSLDEGEIGRHVQAKSIAETKLKVAESLRRKAESVLAAAEAAEKEAARAARYRKVRDESMAQRAKFEREYPELANRILRLAASNARIAKDVAAVNKDLPQGAERLVPPDPAVDEWGQPIFHTRLKLPDFQNGYLWTEFSGLPKLMAFESDATESRVA